MKDSEKRILKKGNKVYFASDFHLGIPDFERSLVREKRIVKWLDEIKADATEIYLVGDLFDFWFEYGKVVPRGYTRLLGKLSELTDQGIAITVFIGNHDMWMFDYLPRECGVTLLRDPITISYNERLFFIGHGDGLGPGDYGYKFIKKVFANSLCQWLFARIHPNFGIAMANFWSGRSRSVNHYTDRQFLGEEKEMLVAFCKEELKQHPEIDYFVFGHRHLPLDIAVGENCRYINLGDWISYFTYAVFDGDEMTLKEYAT
jgi:UDP-2,3-diacylglucosamine hydrolase